LTSLPNYVILYHPLDDGGLVNVRTNRFRRSLKAAKTLWGKLPNNALVSLRELTKKFALCVGDGHLQFLNGRWYITHSGLLKVAENRHCLGITTAVQEGLSEPLKDRWVFKATVYKSKNSRGFVGFGDANPKNVSTLVLGAEMRIAETRAVNRALRKAYGIGLCSVEELGSNARSIRRPNNSRVVPPNGSSNGQPRLRDKLCLLIRNYELDPTLVKRYAADFCGTETLREASRDLVEAFVSTISKEAASDRAVLVCKLNSYNQPEEVRS
jgi:hypothetical protein